MDGAGSRHSETLSPTVATIALAPNGEQGVT